MKGMFRALWYKAIRGAIAAAIASGVVYLQNDARWIVLIPVIQMAGKWVREKKPDWAWLITF